MRFAKVFFLTCISGLAGCTSPPPVAQSQAIVWKKFSHESIDKVLLAWGTPTGETRLTDGSRLISYRHATVNNAASPYEYSQGCEATLLAPPPKYHIKNVALKGDPYECQLLAQGHVGVTSYGYVPPPAPIGIYPVFGYYYR